MKQNYNHAPTSSREKIIRILTSFAVAAGLSSAPNASTPPTVITLSRPPIIGYRPEEFNFDAHSDQNGELLPLPKLSKSRGRS